MTTELKRYIDERFDRLEAATLIGVKTMLTAEEAAAYTGFTIKGIYVLTSKRQIPHYKKSGRLLFKKAELDDWMSETRILTERELESKASTYMATR